VCGGPWPFAEVGQAQLLEMVFERPLPPSAALPLTGENNLIFPSGGGEASEGSEGIAHTPSRRMREPHVGVD
jgi:hypothetical protein